MVAANDADLLGASLVNLPRVAELLFAHALALDDDADSAGNEGDEALAPPPVAHHCPTLVAEQQRKT